MRAIGRNPSVTLFGRTLFGRTLGGRDDLIGVQRLPVGARRPADHDLRGRIGDQVDQGDLQGVGLEGLRFRLPRSSAN